MVNPDLKAYIESEILPRYNHFDTAHDIQHVQRVMAQSMELAQFYPKLKKNMVYTIAAYHDTGMVNGRENHHIDSARIIRRDPQLPRWFDPIDIAVMAQAAEDHRASAYGEPRSLYGKLVAEADRDIEPINIIRRTVQYGIAYYPKMKKSEQWDRARTHLLKKYGPEGYLKLYIPQSRNKSQLEKLQTILADSHLLNSLISEMIERYSK
ncbi:MAG: HD domain-containing protein [Bacteroidales bacterium]|nr:HD domain-containing protein [Bacteroidales bacterium]